MATLAYVPPDVIVNHMIASGAVQATEVHTLKRACATFRDEIVRNEQAIVESIFPPAIARDILGSQLNVPRTKALFDGILQGSPQETSKWASSPGLFLGDAPEDFDQFDNTIRILNNLTKAAEAMVHMRMADWSVPRWMLYVTLRYLLKIVTDPAALRVVLLGRDKALFATRVGTFCSDAIQFSMNPFESKDEDDRGSLHELVGLAYEVWLHADALGLS